MPLLTDKVALVTGAASGIGRETARRFATEGAAVAAIDLEHDPADPTWDDLERTSRVLHLTADVSNADHVRSAVEKTIAQFGRLDIVVANAGINGVWAPIDDLTPEEFDRTIAVNLRGTFLTLHYTVPHLKRAGSGSIIIVSSVNGNRSFALPGATAYSASKAAQVAIARMQAIELAKSNIRVNTVCPGAIHTHIHDSTTQRNTESLGLDIAFPKGEPALNAGVANPPEVADVCLFLASHLSRHVSGTEIYIDGGLSLVR